MAKAASSTAEVRENREEGGDSPLLDTLNAAVKKMVAQGKERGYITYDDLNTTLPPDQVSSEQIEDTMTMLSEMGINVVESEDSEEASAAVAKPDTTSGSAGNVDEADLGRTDDPVRMYLREMGSVELLSREGEIAIAKRIEAGREMMIGGICESPLTIRAIVHWHDTLVAEEMLLRDIIDLEATHGGGPGGAMAGDDENGEDVDETASAGTEKDDKDGKGDKDDKKEAKKAAEGPAKKTNGSGKDETGKAEDAGDAGDNKGEGDDGDDESEEQNLSLAALEAKLTPEVVGTFQQITKTYKKFHRLQVTRLEAIQKGDEIKPSQEKRYGKLRHGLVELMEKVHLNNARIEQLVEQLYDLNRELIGCEGKLLRMATNSK
ncbi:MAG: RNA polymerase sigma factor region1.1 domain-containing protein, partial [Rhodospirillales bacterium]